MKNLRIGQAENAAAATGCTVLIFDKGAPAGLDIRGGGPASRDGSLLDPLANADRIHAVLLSGGSAFGLDAAGGVMRYLEERGIGYDVGPTKVPLVCQSSLFDLSVGDARVRPDADMAYAACVASETGNYRDGNHGVGTGATVGKLFQTRFAMKSGVGSCALRMGELEIGAVVAVNALGDIFDWQTGKQIAGLLNEEKNGLRRTADEMYRSYRKVGNRFVSNTTIGAIVTNAKFDKTKLCKIAGMGHDGMARSIRPVHSTADGDSLYAVSVGEVEADLDMIGTLAADVVSEAILQAVRSAEAAYGFPAARDLNIPD